MKLLLFFTLFCAFVIYNDAKLVNKYGDVKNYDFIGKDTVFQPMNFNGRVGRDITFPRVTDTIDNNIEFILHKMFFLFLKDSYNKFIIRGFKHYDYEERSPNVTVTEGGISKSFITLNIKSDFSCGISSIFHFYGEKL